MENLYNPVIGFISLSLEKWLNGARQRSSIPESKAVTWSLKVPNQASRAALQDMIRIPTAFEDWRNSSLKVGIEKGKEKEKGEEEMK